MMFCRWQQSISVQSSTAGSQSRAGGELTAQVTPCLQNDLTRPHTTSQDLTQPHRTSGDLT